MKTIIPFLCAILIAIPLSGCPTCIGRVVQDSPLFFSKEFYKKELLHAAQDDGTDDELGSSDDTQGEQQ